MAAMVMFNTLHLEVEESKPLLVALCIVILSTKYLLKVIHPQDLANILIY